MTFTLPTFNLVVDVYTGPWLAKVLRLSVMGNLARGRRVQQAFETADTPQISLGGQPLYSLLLPALTDIRDGNQGVEPDILEIPTGSGRWYAVAAYDDVGKGFPNEYRSAFVLKVSQAVSSTTYAGLFWPIPCP
jgi:hypothetical protein